MKDRYKRGGAGLWLVLALGAIVVATGGGYLYVKGISNTVDTVRENLSDSSTTTVSNFPISQSETSGTPSTLDTTPIATSTCVYGLATSTTGSSTCVYNNGGPVTPPAQPTAPIVNDGSRVLPSGSCPMTDSTEYHKCFDQKFASCSPLDFGMSDSYSGGSMAMAWKIVGPKSGGCEVIGKSSVNAGGRTMDLTCNFVLNNNLAWEKAIPPEMNKVMNGTANCSGALWDLLKSRMAQ